MSVEINFTVAGAGREAQQARGALLSQLERCAFTTALQRFIDSHRDQIDYVKVNGRRMDVGNALFELENYLEPGVPGGSYQQPAAQAVPTPTEAPQEVAQPRPTRIEPGAEPEIRSPLEAMRQQEERARAHVQAGQAGTQAQQAEQAEAPPQMQEQRGTLLTLEEAAAVAAVPEAVQEQAGEQVRENVQAINAAVPVMPSELGRMTSYYQSVLELWNELKRLCDQSAIIADRLKLVTEQYYSTLERLDAARGTPGANALQNKVRELEGQMRELSRQLDPLLAKQGQLLTDILAYMPDAFAEAMREPRDRDGMLADLTAIRDEWKSQQEKILAALSLRELGGEIAEALRPALAAARRGSIENMYDVFARMMQTNPVVETQFVDWVALNRAAQASYATLPVGPVGVSEAPIAAETTGGAFEFRSRRGTFRIEIAGEDLSGMTFAELKKRVNELVNDQSISNQQLLGMLTVERIRTGGEEPYRFMSRYLLRTQFFQDYAGGHIRVLETAPLTAAAVPAAVYEAAHALVVPSRQLPVVPPVTAPPAVAPAPTVAPQPAVPAAPAAPTVAQRPAAPTVAPQAPEVAQVAETPEAPAPAPSVPVLEGSPLAAFSRRYGISTQDARDFNQFQRGVRSSVEVEANSEENANRILNFVRLEANRRGVRSEYGIMPPQEGGTTYLIYYRPISAMRAADNAAIEAQNPLAFVGYGARLPMDYTLDLSGINARFNQAFAPYEARLVGFVDAAVIGQNPDSQMPAYAADTLSGLASWVFHVGGERVSGLERTSQLVYARTPQQPVGLTVGDREALFLNQKEAAAFAAAFFTGDAGRAYREIEGRTLNVFEGNIRAALAGRSNQEVIDALGGALGRYAAQAYTRLSQYYGNPALVEEKISTLDPETRMSFEYAAEMLGESMYRMRLAQTGEAESEDLHLACVNSARAILVVKIEAEGGRIAFDKFMYGGREYNVGTNTLFTADGATFALESGKMLSDQLLYVPQPEAGVVLIVGYVKGREAHMLADEGVNPFIYDLRQQGHLRDSLGFAGLTERWTWHLPLIDIRVPEEGMLLEVPVPDFQPVPVAPLKAPPPEPRVATLTGGVGLEKEFYWVGEELNEGMLIIQNPRIDREVIPADQLYEDPQYSKNFFFVFNNFRRVSDTLSYATIASDLVMPTSPIQRRDMFAEPDDIENVAELRTVRQAAVSGGTTQEGVVYLYLNAEGKIVDALTQKYSGGVTQVAIGTYSVTVSGSGGETKFSDLRVALSPEYEQYRGLILVRMGAEEVRTRVENDDRASFDRGENLLSIELTSQAEAREGFTEDIIHYVGFNTRFPMEVRSEETDTAIGSYDLDLMSANSREIASIDAEFQQEASRYMEPISAQEWTYIHSHLAELHDRRTELIAAMADNVASAITTMQATLDELRSRPAGSVPERALANLEDMILRLRTYSRALEASRADMQDRWNEWDTGIRSFEAKWGIGG